ncbi:MAG: hypothetical protein ACON38_14145 [Akkermansiaceae bacterium]
MSNRGSRLLFDPPCSQEKSIEELVAETEKIEAAFRAEGSYTDKPVYDAVIAPSDATK